MTDEEFERLERALDKAERPILADLRALGLELESVWDLNNMDVVFPDSFEVLLKHLKRDYPDPIREGVARALSGAHEHWDELVQLYRAEPADTQTKMGLAVAVSETVMAKGGTVAQARCVVELIHDTSLGPTRLLLLCVIRKRLKSEAREILSQFKDDPELHLEVAEEFKRMDRAAERRRKRLEAKQKTS